MYMFVEPSELTLFDAGMRNRNGGKVVFEAIEQIGRKITDLSRILITHADIDHYGNLADIAEKSGATVYAGEETAQFMNSGQYPDHLSKFQMWLLNNFVRSTPYPEGKVQRLKDGDVLPMLGGTQVLATPGHTPEHFSFFNPQTGVCIVGDTLHSRQGKLGLNPKGITADMIAVKQSAIRLLELSPTVFACGHGEPKSNHSIDEIQTLFAQLK